MPWFVVTGRPPYDGRYLLDLDEADLTIREWGWVKRLSGYMPLTINDGYRGGDAELLAVLVAVAMRRAGRISNDDVPDMVERFQDVALDDTIQIERADGDADSPPPSRSNGSTSTDGRSSPTSSEMLGPPQLPTGIPASAISASGRGTSAS